MIIISISISSIMIDPEVLTATAHQDEGARGDRDPGKF